MAQDKIVIGDLLVRGFIGFQEWEREKKQDILINLTLFADLRRAGLTNDVAETLDYKTIAKTIIAYVEADTTRHDLVESLATAVARLCIEGGAERAIVRIEKPGALRFARSVGVEIERSKADFE
ncbi:MAG: dihydroneopterin aldolase [Chloroflexota bacterium]